MFHVLAVRFSLEKLKRCHCCKFVLAHINKIALACTVGCKGVVQLGGLDTGLSLVDPTKIKAVKSFLFTEGSLKRWNKEHIVDFVVTLYFLFV